MPETYATLETLTRITRETWEILKPNYVFRAPKVPPPDPTPADILAHQTITQRLEEAFPDAQILFEVGVTDIPDYSGRVLMVDPIDGTRQYDKRIPFWSINIAELIDGTPVTGVVYQPTFRRMYSAQVGQGAFVEDGLNSRLPSTRRLQVASITSMLDALQIARIDYEKDLEENHRKDIENLGDAQVYLGRYVRRTLGISSFGMVYISSGQAHAYVDEGIIKKWDTCAHQVILEEAGGRMTDFDGEKLDYTKRDPCWDRGFIATNGQIHEQVQKLMDEYLRESSRVLPLF